jgi:hypothetical protein
MKLGIPILIIQIIFIFFKFTAGSPLEHLSWGIIFIPTWISLFIMLMAFTIAMVAVVIWKKDK